MELIPREIDVFPGKRPQQPLGNGSRSDRGSAIVRLHNPLPNENAMRVSVRGEGNPLWQRDWYVLLSSPATGADAQAARSDDKGQGWVKVYVPRSGSRDVLLQFLLPERPDSRAGTYPFVVEVEISVDEKGQPPRTLKREIRGTLYVHPYYNWDAKVADTEARTSFRRRRTETQVVFTNKGNDWLYCDVSAPQNPQMFAQTTTTRVAVPPPDTREVQSERRIPISIRTKQKALRGEPITNPIMLQAARVHAPSVAPPPDLVRITGMENGAVIWVEPQTDSQRLKPLQGNLVYYPLIPATITGFFNMLKNNIVQLVVAVMALYALVAMLLVAMSSFSTPKIATLQAQTGGDFRVGVRGDGLTFLDGPLNQARFLVQMVNDGKADPATEQGLDTANVKAGRPSAENKPKSSGGMPTLPTLKTDDLKMVTLNLKDYDKKTVRLFLRRGGLFRLLPPIPFLNPTIRVSQDVQVGTPDAPRVALTPPIFTMGGTVAPGGTLEIGVENLPKGATVEEVVLGAKKLKPVSTENGTIKVVIPPDLTGSFGGKIKASGNITDISGNVTVVAAAPLSPPNGGSNDMPPQPNAPGGNGGAPPVAGGNNGGGSTPPANDSGGAIPPPPNASQGNNGGVDSPAIVAAKVIAKLNAGDYAMAQEMAANLGTEGGATNKFLALSAQALAIVRQGDPKGAAKLLTKAADMDNDKANPRDRALFYLATSEVFAASGQAKDAKSWHDAADKYNQQSGNLLDNLFAGH